MSMSSEEKTKATPAAKSNDEDVLSSSFAKMARPSSTFDNITDVVSHLHNLLQTKEQELKEREAEFERRIKSYESTHPSIGDDNDVIQLNVGGKTGIAVLRRTLMQFPESMLAAKFSGRWDDSLEKDRDGNYFVDEDPENFGALLKFLRMRMKQGGSDVPECHRPQMTYEFCSMLEYYNLMQGVYGQPWVGKEDTYTREEVMYGTVSLKSTISESTGDDSTTNSATVVLPQPGFADVNDLKLLEFTVEFEKGSTGTVGWVWCDRGRETSIKLAQPITNSLLLDITERKAFGPATSDDYDDLTNILSENLRINHTESVTKVICRRSGGTGTQKKFSIELEDGTQIDEKLDEPEKSSKHRLLPVISFSGKVTVSGVKYAIDEL